MSHSRWIILGTMLFAALPGCGSSSSTTTDAGTSVPDVGTNTLDVATADTGVQTGALPTVTVTMPAANSPFPYAATTEVYISVTNFSLMDYPPNGGTAANDGHYHIYLDSADGSDYLFADYRSPAEVIIPPGTTLGAHSIRVSLRHPDHSAVGTAGADFTLPIMVTANTGPAVIITTPSDSASVAQGAMVNLSLTVSNITLVEPGGGNMAAQGHYAVYLDSNTGSTTLTSVDTALTTPITIPATTTVGPHRLRVSLRNNDNSPIGPPAAEAGVRINVTAM